MIGIIWLFGLIIHVKRAILAQYLVLRAIERDKNT